MKMRNRIIILFLKTDLGAEVEIAEQNRGLWARNHQDHEHQEEKAIPGDITSDLGLDYVKLKECIQRWMSVTFYTYM